MLFVYGLFIFSAPVVVDINLSLTQYPVGSNISLPCIVNGFPQPTVRWLKNGQPVELSGRIEHTSKSLPFKVGINFNSGIIQYEFDINVAIIF